MASVSKSLTVLTLYTVGPFRLIGPNARDLTPKGRKACGLLAMLAVAPNFERPRSNLKVKLWSDRGAEQGANSLRQALAEIRKAMGPYKDVLVSNRKMISLDQSRVVVVQARYANHGVPISERDDILFEDLDVADAEFENWLTDVRREFVARKMRPAVNPVTSLLEAAKGAQADHKFQLVLEPPLANETSQGIALDLSDVIAKSVSELGPVDVVDRRDASDIGGEQSHAASLGTIGLRTSLMQDHNGQTLRASLVDAQSRRLLWSSTSRFDKSSEPTLEAPDFLRVGNLAVEAALAGYLDVNRARTSAPVQAAALCRQAIQKTLKLGRDNLIAADAQFAQAYELAPRGLYLAWRAYLRTFVLLERYTTDPKTTSDEAIAFMRLALEQEPLNSYVASFSAHVHAVVRRSYVAAYELALRSIQLNRANPMAWSCLGVAESHLGKADLGFQHTLLAREIAGVSPFRYQIDGLSCIVGSVAGDVEKAIWVGEASHAQAPEYKPPLRYLAVLYLLGGHREQSEEVVQKLKRLEPDFSYEMLRERSYPSAGLHRAKLLNALPTRMI